jgi:hypothetical protein
MHIFSLDFFISFVHSRSVSKFTGKTFHHRNGVNAVYYCARDSSSVDYFLVSEYIFHDFTFLHVFPPNELSDHSIVWAGFKTKINYTVFTSFRVIPLTEVFSFCASRTSVYAVTGQMMQVTFH